MATRTNLNVATCMHTLKSARVYGSLIVNDNHHTLQRNTLINLNSGLTFRKQRSFLHGCQVLAFDFDSAIADPATASRERWGELEQCGEGERGRNRRKKQLTEWSSAVRQL